MIETIENGIQLAVTGTFSVISFVMAYRMKEKEWDILALFYAAISLGDLYWLLFLLFYHRAPEIPYVSEFAWYAAYLFLLLLLRYVIGEKAMHTMHPMLWIVPPFVIGMALFYMKFGDYISNIICAFLMGLLLWHTLQGLLCTTVDDGGNSVKVKRRFCIGVLAFCLVEYAMWTSSCIWTGDTIKNPYFFFDFLFTASMAAFLPLFGKAVKA